VTEPELVDMEPELVDVKSVAPLDGYKVHLVFSDGIERTVDLDPYLRGPIFERVRDPEYFQGVRVDPDTGTIVWPNGADIDPLILRFDLAPAWKEEEFKGGIEAHTLPEYLTQRRGRGRLATGRSVPGFIFILVATVPIFIAALFAGRASSLIVAAALAVQAIVIALLFYFEFRLQRQSQQAAIMLVRHLSSVSIVEVDFDGHIRIIASGGSGRLSLSSTVEPRTVPTDSNELAD
jgi:uncharacterized protein DUF2442